MTKQSIKCLSFFFHEIVNMKNNVCIGKTLHNGFFNVILMDAEEYLYSLRIMHLFLLGRRLNGEVLKVRM